MKWLFIGTVACLVFAWMLLHAGYTTQKDTPVTVINKLIVSGSRSGHMEMVLRLDDGTVFDTPVSASTYTMCDVGQRYVMQFTPMDIRQTMTQNLLYFFLPVVLLSFGLVGSLFWTGIFIVTMWRFMGLYSLKGKQQSR